MTQAPQTRTIFSYGEARAAAELERALFLRQLAVSGRVWLQSRWRARFRRSGTEQIRRSAAPAPGVVALACDPARQPS